MFIVIIIDQYFDVVWSAKYPISETNRRVNYDIGNIWVFRFHVRKKCFKVDNVDMVMDKFESMNFSLHFLIIKITDNDFVE